MLLELPVGHYQLGVSAKGFQKYVQEGITLNVNETATIPVHVVVGAESEVVDVMSDAQLIQETVTSLGKVVQEREILDLPLNGRNFTQLKKKSCSDSKVLHRSTRSLSVAWSPLQCLGSNTLQ